MVFLVQVDLPGHLVSNARLLSALGSLDRPGVTRVLLVLRKSGGCYPLPRHMVVQGNGRWPGRLIA
jgi:hypothetical protein